MLYSSNSNRLSLQLVWSFYPFYLENLQRYPRNSPFPALMSSCTWLLKHLSERTNFVHHSSPILDRKLPDSGVFVSLLSVNPASNTLVCGKFSIDASGMNAPTCRLLYHDSVKVAKWMKSILVKICRKLTWNYLIMHMKSSYSFYSGGRWFWVLSASLAGKLCEPLTLSQTPPWNSQ